MCRGGVAEVIVTAWEGVGPPCVGGELERERERENDGPTLIPAGTPRPHRVGYPSLNNVLISSPCRLIEELDSE